jgi:hypothetical protein
MTFNETVSEGPPDRDMVERVRKEKLEECRVAFGVALDIVLQFRALARANPDDVELRKLTDNLSVIFRCLLDTVTCKVLANGLAADWERLFDSEVEA